ncbi:hypothetical protein Cyast_0734 [Cyanobacterium stanieri PCC 7202]|uniref:Toxin-antitoxin system, antitoxin component, ribbon-helix-helix domain protein n=1 Tax=Cyanobacterium stanieri (strain ATCC 29140 / PCC 7202) TaxID=292563 RepID=K9YJR9_CYASC|nr:hypothetical protein Cyast_0734 [Cyanobacterium stanieri PCC 7202]
MIINAQISDALYEKIKHLSSQENISIDELVSIALSNQLSYMDKNFLAERAKKGSWENFQNVLSKVSDQEPEKCDRI